MPQWDPRNHWLYTALLMLGRELRMLPELAYGRPPDAPDAMAGPEYARPAWKRPTDSPDTRPSRQGFVRSDAMTCALRGRTSRLRTSPGCKDLRG